MNESQPHISLLHNSALRYAKLGYPVFPCAPGSKKPLTKHGHLEATLDVGQVDQWWTQRPNANIGIATSGLAVIDVDQGATWLADQPDRVAELDVAPLSLTANSGRQYLFRQPADKSWRNTSGRLASHVDTRAEGGYVVVAPSVLEGGKVYRWAEGLELHVPPENLPEPPDWLIKILDGLAETPPSRTARSGGSSRRTTLASVASHTSPGNAIPSGQRNATLARLAGTMRRVGMSEAEIVAAMERANVDRCIPPLDRREVQRIAASVAQYAPDEVAVALTENHWDQMYRDEPESPSEHADPGPIPVHLLRVPGFINDVIDYTLASAPYPEPALAFCGAIALQSLLTSRKVRDEADNRTNLYVLGLANSGAGKDFPRKVNQRILFEVGLIDCLGDAFASGEGIEDRLFLNPSVLFQTDEIDGLMTKINQARDARHEGVMNVLLKMYTSSSSVYPMRVKAGRETGVIDQPCLCIFGTAIPKHYYEALSLKMLTNGFFARMLVLETQRRGKGQDAAVRNLPQSVLDVASWWAEQRPGQQGNLERWHPVPKVVLHTPEAADVLRQLRIHADDQYSLAEDRDDPAGMAIWARANEKARRLALIYACSENHENPVIQKPAAQWAWEFVEHQTRRMLFMAGDHISENEFGARCKVVLGSLRQWNEKHGDSWMPFWKLNRRHPWSEREHNEVRSALLNQRLIEYDGRKTGGTPQRLYRL
ncbi:MAG: bifunctional DNA primase/polymerase, partial [Planctomycetaceae bacterium]